MNASVDPLLRNGEVYFAPTITLVIIVVLLAGLWLFVLQRLIRKRTRELAEKNEMLRLAQKDLSDKVDRRTIELAESEGRYRTYIEVTGQLGWSTDAAGLVVRDLPFWRKYSGQTFEEIKGWGWLTALHPADKAGTEKVWRQSVTERRPYEVEYRIRRHDGVYRHFLARGIPIFKDDGSIQEWVGTCIDITERKRLEDELQRIGEDLVHAQEVGNIGSWRMDVRTDILTWSDENYRIFGVPRGTPMTYEKFLSIVHPDDREYVDIEWKAGLAGKPYDIQHRIIVDGKIKWVREKAYREFDQKGGLQGGFGITQDITERKRVEEELRKAQDKLEERVRIRTLELQEANEALQAEIQQRKRVDEEKKQIEAQMLRAQRMESIGTLAAGIAHDFNNILTPIMLNSATAMMDLPEDSPLRKYLERTLTSAKRARSLVQQILTFSRKGDSDLKTLKFQDILSEALKLLRASIPSTIEIQTRIEPCGSILADPTQMHQIIMNICTNAYQAMVEKGGTLSITLEEVDFDAEPVRRNMNLKPGRYVRFAVEDTGCGMDEATRERIFDPFFSTKGAGGTGLGLSVVLGIVVGHGGDIDVRSEPGKGTTFQVYLPRAMDDIKQEEDEREESIPTGKERILFVDDESDIALMGEEMSRRLGYDTFATTDSAKALEEFRAHSGKYDLIVTDYTMPRINGLELARELKSIRPDIPIVLTTGFNEAMTAEKLHASGIATVIMKPYTIEDLARVIRQTIDGSRASSAALPRP